MPEPIRVLQVVTQMHRAGLETMLMNYYRHMDRKTIQFDFLVHRAGDYDYDDEIRQLGGRIFHVPPITGRGFRAYLKALDSFFAQHREYRIVHCHLDALSGFALKAAKKAGVPVRIAHSHCNGFDKDKKRIVRYLAKAIIPLYATYYMGCSAEAVAFMFGRAAAAGLNAEIIPNAIDFAAFAFHADERERTRRLLGINDAYVVGHIGRLSYSKNHKFLLDIFCKILNIKRDTVLILVGAGEEAENIRNQAAALKIADKVHFLGSRADIASLLSAMDVFVLPSHFEGFGMVLLEAQVNGLPCVASENVCGEADVSGRIKFLSLGESAKVWADAALDSVGGRYDAIKRIRAAGFDIKEQAQKLQARYLAMLESRDE